MGSRSHIQHLGTMAGATDRKMLALPNIIDPTPAMYIDVPKALSSKNHRLYRQNRSYRVKLKVHSSYNYAIQLFTIRNTWMFRKAYGLASDMYYDQFKEEKKAGMKFSRWHDFRILPDTAGNTVLEVPTLMGMTLQNVPNQPYAYANHVQDEWDSRSEIRDGTGATRGFAVGGVTTASTYGIIHEYDRQTDTKVDDDTITPDEMPYIDLYGNANEEEAHQMQQEANLPPYDADALGTNAWLGWAGELHSSSTGSYQDTIVLDAPLGWVFLLLDQANVANQDLLPANGGPGVVGLTVEALVGDYNGVDSVPLNIVGA